MKTRRFAVTVLALACTLVTQSWQTSTAAPRPRYSARLLTPRPGDVLVPGQTVRVTWESALPNVDFSWCEIELYLSIDGGRTNLTRITPQLDPHVKYFDWVVPNIPTSAAVLDIHFGCEGFFPESAAVQRESTFVIRAVQSDY